MKVRNRPLTVPKGRTWENRLTVGYPPILMNFFRSHPLSVDTDLQTNVALWPMWWGLIGE